MTKAINIYSLSRINEKKSFNIIGRHLSGSSELNRTQSHEMNSLKLLADEFVKNGVSIEELDGFFWSYTIPQISKEFDLLKITDTVCLNIELKSNQVPEEQIRAQLLKNRHYLGHLGRQLMFYSVVTDTMACYKLSPQDELIAVDFSEIVADIKKLEEGYKTNAEELFKPADYLISPLNTPLPFIRGEYFLTSAQEQIKKSIMDCIDSATAGAFLHLTGDPGTGKTLLLYDLAKALAEKEKTLIIHCGKLSEGQSVIAERIEQLDIISPNQLSVEGFAFDEYSFILVDETHRIYPEQFDEICDLVQRNNQSCIFSSDPGQILSNSEKENAIVEKIEAIPPDGEYTLPKRIRTNKALQSFISNVMDLKHKSKAPMDYSSVVLNYANTTQEAQLLLEYYREKDYTFINYSKSFYLDSPYSAYEEDFDTHHVIGQEFDKVVMLVDQSFYYDDNGILQGVKHPTPDYLYPNLFYQGVTRVREQLALIVVENEALFDKIVSIVV